MALHPDFPTSPHDVLLPGHRWFPADEALRDTTSDKLIPPLVATLRRKVQEFRQGGYVGATDTSRSLLRWWFQSEHLIPQSDGPPLQQLTFLAARGWTACNLQGGWAMPPGGERAPRPARQW